MTTMALMQFINLFSTFFLANIASRYVGEYIDGHVRRMREKVDFDQKLGSKLLCVSNYKDLSKCADDISEGEVYRRNVDNLRDFLEIYNANTRFFNRGLQRKFVEFATTLEELSEFMFAHFSVTNHDHSMLWIHKYENAEDGHILYENNLRTLNEILDRLIESAKNLENALLRSFRT